MSKVLFEIDTKGICLFCLEKQSPLSGLDGESSLKKEEQSRTCFKMLLRYLKVNILKLCQFQPSFLQTMDVADESAEATITLCNDCSAVTEKFYNLFQQFELIRMQLDKCVQTVCESIKSGNGKQDCIVEYKKQMRTMHGVGLFNACLVDNLKKEILQKCATKMDTSAPKVILAKLQRELSQGQAELCPLTTTLTEDNITTSPSPTPSSVVHSIPNIPVSSEETCLNPTKKDNSIVTGKQKSRSPSPIAAKENSNTENFLPSTKETVNSTQSQTTPAPATSKSASSLKNAKKSPFPIKLKNPVRNENTKESPTPITPVVKDNSSIDNLHITESLDNDMDFEEHFSVNLVKLEVDETESQETAEVCKIDITPNSSSSRTVGAPFKHYLKGLQPKSATKSPFSSSSSSSSDSSDDDYVPSAATATFEKQTIQNGNEELDFQCKECGNAFESKMALIGHFALHSRAKSSMLTAVETVFKKKLNLKLGCKICGVKFTTSHSLKRHLNSHKFQRASTTKTHPLDMIQCGVCRRNIRVKNWESHQEVHSGEAPYKCEYCDRRFRDFTQKDNHEKSQHTIEVFSKELPSGTTSKNVDILMGCIYSQFKLSSEKGIKYITCPFCPTRLIRGQRLKSKTHVLKKHFDEVLIKLRSQPGTNPTPGLVQEEAVASKAHANVPFVMDFEGDDEDELQHPSVDPLNEYD